MDKTSRFSFFSEQKAGRRIIYSMTAQSISAFFFLALYSYTRQLSLIPASQLAKLNASTSLLGPNLLGLVGAKLSYFFIIKTFGVSAFFIPLFFFLLSLKFLFPKKITFSKAGSTSLFMLVWTSMTLGYLYPSANNMKWYRIPGRAVTAISANLKDLIGIGTLLFLIFSLIGFLLVIFGIIYSSKNKQEEATLEGPKAGPYNPKYQENRNESYNATFSHAELRSTYFAYQPQQRTYQEPQEPNYQRYNYHYNNPQYTTPQPAPPPNYKVEEPITTYQQHLESKVTSAPQELEETSATAKHVGYATAQTLFSSDETSP